MTVTDDTIDLLAWGRCHGQGLLSHVVSTREDSNTKSYKILIQLTAISSGRLVLHAFLCRDTTRPCDSVS